MIRGGASRRHPLAGTVDVVVIGAGHAGLAMSQYLSQCAIDHVVLERGEVANSWRHERWDSLRLLTPNWQSRLPRYKYTGADPDGYMSMPALVSFIERYARLIDAPVRTGTTVTSVVALDDGYRVITDRGRWHCRAFVIASGAQNIPHVPKVAESLPNGVRSLPLNQYRNPEQLDSSGVLVVGASASGIQLADELQRSGRQVTLAVGEHIRMPRVYRGMDIQWWLDAAGVLDERYDQVDDIERARQVPSPQLTGSEPRATLDLNALMSRGVEVVGRVVGMNGSRAQFSGSLANHCAMADLKLNRLLDRFDAWALGDARGAMASSIERFEATQLSAAPQTLLDLTKHNVGTVLWATGFKPDYRWLQLPVLDQKGRLRHDGGVVASPGVYALGLSFMRRRKSSFIHGIEDDVRELGSHLLEYLHRRRNHGAPARTSSKSAAA